MAPADAVRQRHRNGKSSSKDISAVSTKRADEVADDAHHEYEFGGPVGVFAMMTGFPALFYYLYVCMTYYNGKFATPDKPAQWNGVGGWKDFLETVVGLVVNNAAPTKKAVALYLSLLIMQLLFAFVMPGVKQQGLPVSSLGGRTLTYNCNAYSALYATIAVIGALHYTGQFNMADIIDLYGPLLTVASIAGFLLALGTYVTGEGYRMSGNLVYDYFMGSTLNPRIGSVDIKMFCEIRVSWAILFAIAMGCVAKQHQEYGYVSANAWLFAYGTWLYVNACAKGEQFIPQTWDMNYEKFGWLLSYWNLAGVPFSYCYPALYMATHDPTTYRYSTPVISALFVILTVSYCLFDISMGQKSWFKAMRTNTYVKRYTFPQLPFIEIEKPKTLETKRGPLLIAGMWGFLRKPNYTFDNIQAWCWALAAGSECKICYFYPVFHLIMLLHRNARDDARCARKYGDDWVAYKKQVPYSYIPLIW